MWIVMGLWGVLQLQSVDVVILLFFTRCWCAEVMALRVLSSQVPLPLRVRRGPCLGLEVLDCSSYEGVCVLQSKCLLGSAWLVLE